jgi:hypothetical protein
MTTARGTSFLLFCSTVLGAFNATADSLDGASPAEAQERQQPVAQSETVDTFVRPPVGSPLQAQVEQNAETPQEKTAQGKNATSERIGEEPEEVAPSRVFLRAQAVTLTPGQVEVELPLTYARDDLLGFRRRELAFTPTVRAGLIDRLEANVDLPLVWRENETVPRPVIRPEAKDDTADIGDIGFGLKYALLPEGGPWPNIIGLLNVVTPSGKAPNPLDGIQASTGTGRWRTSFGLSAIRSFDPATLFGGIAYEINFDETLNSVEVSGGNRFTYNFGTGFAVNNQLTLSGIFLGEFREEVEFNGQRLAGTDIEPMSMRAIVTYRAASKQFIEPSVEWGLNDDAVDTRLRLSYIVRF